MADLMYGKIAEVWGEKSFIENDYREYRKEGIYESVYIRSLD